MKGIKGANPLNIDSTDIQQFFDECNDNEGRTSKTMVLDYIIKRMYFTYDDMDNTKMCVIGLKDVEVRSNIGNEELGDVNMVDNLDGKGFNFAF
jgi:hypothetical protein